MMKKNYFVCFFVLLLIQVSSVNACLVNDLKEKNMYLIQIGKNTILNGSPIQMYDLVSRSCSLECYMNFLDKKNIRFSKQGSLFYIAENGGTTIQIFSANQQSFSGRVVCPSKAKYKLLQSPDYIKLPKATTDFQSEDYGEVNRTMVFKSFKRMDYQNLISQLQKKSKVSDVNDAFSYFDLGEGNEINLIFDARKSISTLVFVNIKKGSFK
ncbi:hypothetical protein NDN13_01650 [Acinetobacter sp. C32I]|uniref:hypothetical protein n=1 Tax=Acinetobacter sp. C32I TaxID=2950074 RepID=UPI002036FA06|nr:hypothetical protein [Acinetobacter sp. C32I]USA53924.1 hypothetical protein NDN13_01650 [Acinetobacter sp. C32I]